MSGFTAVLENLIAWAEDAAVSMNAATGKYKSVIQLESDVGLNREILDARQLLAFLKLDGVSLPNCVRADLPSVLPIAGPVCCNHNCNQGRDCPLRTEKNIAELPILANTLYLDKTKP